MSFVPGLLMLSRATLSTPTTNFLSILNQVSIKKKIKRKQMICIYIFFLNDNQLNYNTLDNYSYKIWPYQIDFNANYVNFLLNIFHFSERWKFKIEV